MSWNWLGVASSSKDWLVCDWLDVVSLDCESCGMVAVICGRFDFVLKRSFSNDANGSKSTERRPNVSVVLLSLKFSDAC